MSDLFEDCPDNAYDFPLKEAKMDEKMLNMLNYPKEDCSCVTCQLARRIKELEERQKWIDEVARPTHPDDERPWCAAYLDCRERIKELKEGIERVLKWRNLDGDGISDPLRKELYNLVKKDCTDPEYCTDERCDGLRKLTCEGKLPTHEKD